MIHNFWSSQYIARRFRENAGEYMKVVDQPEAGTSRTCPRCGSDWTFKRKRLFKCLNCGLEAHGNVVGALNIAALHNGME